jgi:hypothetical protein
MSEASNPTTKHKRYGRYAAAAGVLATALIVANVVYEQRWFTIFANGVEPWLLTVTILCWGSDRLLPYLVRIPRLVASIEAARKANESVAAALAATDEEPDTAPMLRLVPSVLAELDERSWRPPSANSRTS